MIHAANCSRESTGSIPGRDMRMNPYVTNRSAPNGAAMRMIVRYCRFRNASAPVRIALETACIFSVPVAWASTQCASRHAVAAPTSPSPMTSASIVNSLMLAPASRPRLPFNNLITAPRRKTSLFSAACSSAVRRCSSRLWRARCKSAAGQFFRS